MKRFFIALFFLIPSLLLAQNPSKSPASTFDSVITINQNALSRFLQIIGPISGTTNIQSALLNSEVKWTVKNPKIILKNNAALFSADVNIIAKNGLVYNTVAKGEVGISYVPSKNIISVKVKRASFELAFNLFGNKFHLTDIDITKYYNADMDFSAPQTVPTTMVVFLPDGSQKSVSINSVKRNLSIEPEYVVVTSELDFSMGVTQNVAVKK
jgi:hypothetical protein